MFTHSKHLCRLDVGIWMLTLSALSWKSPSLNSHTQSSELQHTHIFLCFFQLCFLLLDSHDKHLPHFVLLLLEFTQEFIPLCFIGLLKTVKNTEKKKQSEVCFKHSPVLPAFGDLTTFSRQRTLSEVPDYNTGMNVPTKTSPGLLGGNSGRQTGKEKNEHTVQDPVDHLTGRTTVLKNKQPLCKHLEQSLMLTWLVIPQSHTSSLLPLFVLNLLT